MPYLDFILIHPADLQEILNQLAAMKHSGPVKIIDCKWSYTVRDQNEMFLCEIKKSELENANG